MNEANNSRFAQRLVTRGLYELVNGIALKHGVDVNELAGKGRSKAVTAARHEAMRAIRERFQWSYPELGFLFNRDHTSVMYGCGATNEERRKHLAATRGAA
jgi:chromosomal replication initiation ATPase DnaA